MLCCWEEFVLEQPTNGMQVKRWRRDLHKWDPDVGEDEEVIEVHTSLFCSIWPVLFVCHGLESHLEACRAICLLHFKLACAAKAASACSAVSWYPS